MNEATDQPKGWDRPNRQNPPELDEPSTAVAKRSDIEIGLPVRTLDEAFRMSNALAHSSLVPDSLRGKGPDILAVLLYGRELGLSVWQSINGIHVIEGRPSMSAELRVAKTRERGHLVGIACAECGNHGNDMAHLVNHFAVDTDREDVHRFVPDWNNERCTVKAMRGDTGEIAVVTWTVEDAIQAGKLRRMPDGTLQARGRSGGVLPWEATTKDMLYARASARACRLIAPEVGYGLYAPDETAEEPLHAESTVDETPVARSTSDDGFRATVQAVLDMEEEPADV